MKTFSTFVSAMIRDSSGALSGKCSKIRLDIPSANRENMKDRLIFLTKLASNKNIQTKHSFGTLHYSVDTWPRKKMSNRSLKENQSPN